MACTIKRRKWSNEDLVFLRENYGNNNRQWLADQLGRQPQQITKKARSLGLKASSRWTDDENKLFFQHFENSSQEHLQSLFPSRTWKAIFMHGRELGLFRVNKCRKNHRHDAFFTYTEGSCYFAGFTAADGHISCREVTASGRKGVTHSLQFEVAEYDKDILLSLQEFLEGKGLTRQTNRKTIALQLGSKSLCLDLHNNFNIPLTNKTYSIEPPDLPQDMKRHFIRGLFDGDGSILKERGKHRFQLLGNRPMLEWVSEELPVDTSQITVRKRAGIEVYCLSLSSRKCREALEWLYAGSKYFLGRKFVKYLETLEYVDGRSTENTLKAKSTFL